MHAGTSTGVEAKVAPADCGSQRQLGTRARNALRAARRFALARSTKRRMRREIKAYGQALPQIGPPSLRLTRVRVFPAGLWERQSHRKSGLPWGRESSAFRPP